MRSTRPSPESPVVETAKLRSPPSFSAYDVRSFIGQSGHGVRSSGRSTGGSPSSSICVTDAAPSRCALADAVGAGVAAADHDHVLAGRGERGRAGAGDRAVPVVEVLHREVHAVELAARHRQVARHARARREHDGVVALEQLGRLDVDADVDAVAELDALLGELAEAPLDDGLLDLEVGDAETEKPAARLVALEHGDGVPRAVQLLRGGETRRAGADDGDAPARALARRLRDDPALLPGAVDDRELDLLDRHRIALVDLEHARRLARRGAEAAGELGEVVRPVELLDRLVEPLAIDEVVPVGDQVPERAAAVAERHAALHAARALLLQLDERQELDELAMVADALAGRALGRVRAVDLQEGAELAHHATAASSLFGLAREEAVAAGRDDARPRARAGSRAASPSRTP